MIYATAERHRGLHRPAAHGESEPLSRSSGGISDMCAAAVSCSSRQRSPRSQPRRVRSDGDPPGAVRRGRAPGGDARAVSHSDAKRTRFACPGDGLALSHCWRTGSRATGAAQLLSNAFKFTPEGGLITVTANRSVCSSKSPCGHGVGFPWRISSGIFEAYEQRDRRKTAEGRRPGSGHRQTLVDLHGGQIWCRERTRPGSTFTFPFRCLPDGDPGK